jgi:hypothetical protein
MLLGCPSVPPFITTLEDVVREHKEQSVYLIFKPVPCSKAAGGSVQNRSKFYLEQTRGVGEV